MPPRELPPRSRSFSSTSISSSGYMSCGSTSSSPCCSNGNNDKSRRSPSPCRRPRSRSSSLLGTKVRREDVPHKDDTIATLEAKIELCIQHYGPEHSKVGHLYNLLGNAWFRHGNLVRAKKAYRAVHCQKKDVAGAACSNMGTVLLQEQNLESALEYLQEALRYYDSCLDSLDVAKVHHQIGFIHSLSGKYAPSIESLQKAYYTREKLGDWVGVGRTLESLGRTHVSFGDYLRGMDFFSEAVRVLEPLGVDLSSILGNVANALVACGGSQSSSRRHYQFCSDHPGLRWRLAEACFHAGDAALAQECQLLGTSPTCLY